MVRFNMREDPVILVADDERMSRTVIEDALNTDHYVLVMAESGNEALLKIDEFSPDLILLDISMSEINGMSLLGKIRDNSLTRFTPVVMIASSMERNHRIKAIEMGADGFMTKPFDSLELRARVTSRLKHKAYLDEILRDKKQLESKIEFFDTLIKELNAMIMNLIFRDKENEESLDATLKDKTRLQTKIDTLMEELNSTMQTIQKTSNRMKSIDDSCDLMKTLTKKQ